MIIIIIIFIIIVSWPNIFASLRSSVVVILFFNRTSTASRVLVSRDSILPFPQCNNDTKRLMCTVSTNRWKGGFVPKPPPWGGQNATCHVMRGLWDDSKYIWWKLLCWGIGVTYRSILQWKPVETNRDTIVIDNGPHSCIEIPMYRATETS